MVASRCLGLVLWPGGGVPKGNAQEGSDRSVYLCLGGRVQLWLLPDVWAWCYGQWVVFMQKKLYKISSWTAGW